jgi:hypothetical protein
MDRSVSGNQRIRKFPNADLAIVPNKSGTCEDKFFYKSLPEGLHCTVLQEFAGALTLQYFKSLLVSLHYLKSLLEPLPYFKSLLEPLQYF